MSLGLAILVVVGFALIVKRSGLVGHAKEAGDRGRSSLTVLADRSLGDNEKELRLRAEAFALFRLFGRILLGSALAILLPLGLVWVLGLIGVGSLSEVLALLGRMDFLLAITLAWGLGYWGFSRVRGQ